MSGHGLSRAERSGQVRVRAWLQPCRLRRAVEERAAKRADEQTISWNCRPAWAAKTVRQNHVPDPCLPLLHRHPMLRIARSDVVRAGADQAVVVELFYHVRGPAADSRDGKDRRE